MRQILIIFHFYGNFAILCSAINLGSATFAGLSKNASYALAFALVKMLSNFLIGVIFHSLRPATLYYYHNLGYSSLQIHLSVFILDMLIWLLIMLLFNAL